MDITKATVLYLSGTGTTEKYARAFADALPYECAVQALRADVDVSGAYGKDELLVVAGPVFAGSMPAFLWQRLADVRGEGTPVVLLAVYGARDYDNALSEMQAKLAEKGFVTVGAAALVARHSIVQTVAANRPDADDVAQVRDFARTLAERVASLESIEGAPTFEFKSAEVHEGPKLVPSVSDDCIECGVCAGECPAGAIPADAPSTTEAEVCISCLRCTEVCPNGARALPAPVIEHVAGIVAAGGARDDKPNEFF